MALDRMCLLIETIITTAVRVELLAADLRFAPRGVVFGDALASDGVGKRP